MLEVDHQLREPNRNELFARAARSIGEAETLVSGAGRLYTLHEAREAQIKTVEALQQMLMLIVKIERMAENAIRSRL